MHSPYDRKKSFRSDLSVKVAFTGEIASYTYLAAKSFFTRFTSNATFHTVKNLQSMFQSILDGENIYGITPLESSSYGTIHAVYDRLLTSQGQFTIVGEIGQIEQHCLCVKTSFSSANDFDIARIISHPHIMECCSDYLESIDSRRVSLGLKPTERENAWDSTAGCEEVNRSSDVVTACICSKEAAELHGLRILTSSIGNYKNAETRYVIIAKVNKADETVHDPLDVCHPIVDRSLSLHEKTGPKCSIAMALRNIPGAIFKMSSCFAFRNLDIIKIESRPATISMQLNLPAEARPFTQKHWDLIFYIDYEPSDNNEVNDSLLRNLSEYCLWIRHLGSYQSGLHSLDQQPSEWHSIMEVVSC